MKKLAVILGIFYISFGLFAPQARAIEIVHPSPQDRGNVTVPATESHKNLYVAGGSVTVDSATNKDLFVAGGTVVINGNVGQDLFAAGGNVTINGEVASNAHVAGGTLVLNGPISGDLLAAGGTVTLGEKAAVNGDLTLGGGTITLDAPVSGTVRIAGGSIYINSKIGGDVMARATTDLTFGPKADVAGKISYTGKTPAVVQDGAKVGNIDYHKLESPSAINVGAALAGGIIVTLLAWLLAGLLLIRFFPKKSNAVVESVYKSPWSSLGIGFLGLIAVPVATFILLIIFIGYYVAAFIFLWYLLLIMLAALLSALFLGALIVKVLTKKPDLLLDWQAVVIGVVVMRLLMFIPILGWLVCAVLFLMVFGGLLRLAKSEIANS